MFIFFLKFLHNKPDVCHIQGFHLDSTQWYGEECTILWLNCRLLKLDLLLTIITTVESNRRKFCGKPRLASGCSANDYYYYHHHHNWLLLLDCSLLSTNHSLVTDVQTSHWLYTFTSWCPNTDWCNTLLIVPLHNNLAHSSLTCIWISS